jgi:hypothetical protein
MAVAIKTRIVFLFALDVYGDQSPAPPPGSLTGEGLILSISRCRTSKSRTGFARRTFASFRKLLGTRPCQSWIIRHRNSGRYILVYEGVCLAQLWFLDLDLGLNMAH